jgi:hypothetical protein
MSLCLSKRRREDLADDAGGKTLRIDKLAVQELTLRRIMAAGHSKSRDSLPSVEPSFILCEGCHKRAPPAEATIENNWSLVGECRFCSRRSLCVDCWARCASCGMETCPLCSVKDYSGRDTVAICLDCKRHQTQKPIIRR